MAPKEFGSLTSILRWRNFGTGPPSNLAASAVDRATLLHARVTIESPDGKRATGVGSMPLGNVWSFPSRSLSYQQTLDAMKGVANRAADLTCPNGNPPTRSDSLTISNPNFSPPPKR